MSVKTIKVAAAASLKNGLKEIITAFKVTNAPAFDDTKFVIDFGGSYDLANKIVSSTITPDIFLAADCKAMTIAGGKVATTPLPFIANSLVLLKNTAGSILTNITSFSTVTSGNIEKEQHIWIADPDLAPAGEYAKKAFDLTTPTSNWPFVCNKATDDETLGDDVQATLQGLIDDGDVTPDPIPAVGVVYYSDYNNATSSGITFVAYAPKTVNTDIVYPAARLTYATNHDVVAEVDDFIDFLTDLVATGILTGKGFRLVGSPAPGV